MQERLFEAVKAKDLAAVKQICEERPELVNSRDGQGNSPILLAAYYGATEIVRFLLNSGATLNVYEASAIGQTEAVRGMLRQKPELLNSFSHDGFTPVGLAAFFGRADIVKHLLELGADVRTPSYNAMRVTPLHSAAAGRHTDVASLLLEHGADPNARQQSGWTPLHSAVHNKQPEMVRLLLGYGADPDAPNDAGMTPRAMAREGGDAGVLELLGD